MDAKVHVEGGRELRAALRHVDKAFPKELRIAHRDVAEIIAEAARRRGAALGGIHAKAAPAIKAGASQRGGYIRLRPTRTVPFLLGAEFGADHNVPRTVRTPSGGTTERLGWNQLPSWRGNQYLSSGDGPGYMVYPSIRANRDKTVDEYRDRLDALLRRAGLL